MTATLNILPDKPKRGEPCNGCGACCASELCEIGKMMFSADQLPCPALAMSLDGTRTVCSLVATEIAMGMEPILQTCLGVGLGCSMDD